MGLLDNLSAFAASDEGMGLAQGLLSARGSAGLAAGLAGMTQAKENAARRRMQELQMQTGQLQLSNAQREQEKQHAMQAMYAKFAQPESPGMGATNLVNEAMPPSLRIGAQPAIGTQSGGGYDYQGLMQAMSKVDPMAALALGDKLRKEGPKFGTEPRVGINPSTGKPGTYLAAENGSIKWVDAMPRDKLEEVNLGGKVGFRNPYETDIQGGANKTVSPDTLANNAVSMRVQNMTDARAGQTNEIQKNAQRTQLFQTPEGILSVDKGTGQATPVMQGGAPVRSEDAMKKTAGANNVLNLLDQAEGLLPGATGSTIGAIADSGAQVFGAATKGAKNTAKLKAIEGSLLMSMPRMEGPQSDKDVANYKAAAGNLADPTVPAKIRQASVDAIREIQGRYASGVVQPAQPRTPMKGQIVEGYKFKGGDPSAQSSWEKQ